jgi:hypothetical protein
MRQHNMHLFYVVSGVERCAFLYASLTGKFPQRISVPHRTAPSSSEDQIDTWVHTQSSRILHWYKNYRPNITYRTYVYVHRQGIYTEKARPVGMTTDPATHPATQMFPATTYDQANKNAGNNRWEWIQKYPYRPHSCTYCRGNCIVTCICTYQANVYSYINTS